MASKLAPTKLSILGKESIVVDYGIWGTWIAEDLFMNLATSQEKLTSKDESISDDELKSKDTITTFILVTDQHLSKLYVPHFQKAYHEVALKLKKDIRLLICPPLFPGEVSKTRVCIDFAVRYVYI